MDRVHNGPLDPLHMVEISITRSVENAAQNLSVSMPLRVDLVEGIVSEISKGLEEKYWTNGYSKDRRQAEFEIARQVNLYQLSVDVVFSRVILETQVLVHAPGNIAPTTTCLNFLEHT